MCHGFSHFSAFLHYFVLAKLATSSIRVEKLTLLKVSIDIACPFNKLVLLLIPKYVSARKLAMNSMTLRARR